MRSKARRSAWQNRPVQLFSLRSDCTRRLTLAACLPVAEGNGQQQIET